MTKDLRGGVGDSMSCLTISREFGAGGTYIAAKLAEKLNYTRYDAELLNSVALKMGKEPQDLESMEPTQYNRLGAFFKEAFASLAAGSLMLNTYGLGTLDFSAVEYELYPDIKEQPDYYTALKQVVCEVAKKDRAIIMGRGGFKILKDFPGIVHCRVIANIEDRIAQIVSDGRATPEEAERAILKRDKAVEHFVEDYFDEDWAAPHNYSIVLNTSKISKDECVEILLSMLNKNN